MRCWECNRAIKPLRLFFNSFPNIFSRPFFFFLAFMGSLDWPLINAESPFFLTWNIHGECFHSFNTYKIQLWLLKEFPKQSTPAFMVFKKSFFRQCIFPAFHPPAKYFRRSYSSRVQYENHLIFLVFALCCCSRDALKAIFHRRREKCTFISPATAAAADIQYRFSQFFFWMGR